MTVCGALAERRVCAGSGVGHIAFKALTSSRAWCEFLSLMYAASADRTYAVTCIPDMRAPVPILHYGAPCCQESPSIMERQGNGQGQCMRRPCRCAPGLSLSPSTDRTHGVRVCGQKQCLRPPRPAGWFGRDQSYIAAARRKDTLIETLHTIRDITSQEQLLAIAQERVFSMLNILPCLDSQEMAMAHERALALPAPCCRRVGDARLSRRWKEGIMRQVAHGSIGAALCGRPAPRR